MKKRTSSDSVASAADYRGQFPAFARLIVTVSAADFWHFGVSFPDFARLIFAAGVQLPRSRQTDAHTVLYLCFFLPEERSGERVSASLLLSSIITCIIKIILLWLFMNT